MNLVQILEMEQVLLSKTMSSQASPWHERADRPSVRLLLVGTLQLLQVFDSWGTNVGFLYVYRGRTVPCFPFNDWPQLIKLRLVPDMWGSWGILGIGSTRKLNEVGGLPILDT